MSPELDKKIVEKYPKIFADRYEDMQKTAMCWGFEHSDGWYWLLDQLCDSIQSYIDTNNNYRDKDKQIPQVVATQVKEKWGTLNFYYTGGDDMIDGMISLAENMSSYICEICGTTENVGITIGWLTNVCKKCHDSGINNSVSNRIWLTKEEFKKELLK